MAATTKWRIVITGICLVCIVEQAATSQEVMKNLSTGFSKVLEQCRAELNLGDHILQDFFNFWREEYQLLNSDMGCVVLCMAQKLDLMGEDMKMHHGNAHQFAKSHGADDALAQQLVTMIHECEKAHQEVAEHCSRILETAKCFRTKIHQLQWAPSMEHLLEEFMISV